MFSSEEKALIKTFSLRQKHDIIIKFIESGQKEDKSINNFLSELSDLSPHIQVKTEQKKDNHLPEIVIAENIKYAAVPLAQELEPFLNALLPELVSSQSILSQKVRKDLKKIEIPVKLKLFVAGECPHCAGFVNNMAAMAHACKNIDVTIIDAALFTKEAARNSIMSVPCLVLDEEFRWTGTIAMEEITHVLADRDPAGLKAENLRTILENGKASWLTRQMIAKNMIFPEFIKLVIHGIWSVRLGAMVVVEELAEKNIELANKICPVLWKQYPSVSMDVKGDILYAIGEAGTSKDIKLIENTIKSSDSPELKEAARDALENIRLRY